MPRVLEANRHEKFDREIMNEMGALGLLGSTLPEKYGCAGANYVAYGLVAREVERVDSRLPLGDERAVLAGHASDLRLRHRRAAHEVPAQARHRRVGRLLRPDRARPRLRSRRHEDARRDGRRRLPAHRAPRCGSPTRRSPTCCVVWAKLDGGAIRGFILERGRKGLETPKIEGKFSLRASVTGEIVMDDVFVPDENLLPNVAGLGGPFGCLNNARYGIAWGAMGAAEFCWHAGAQLHARPQAVRPAARRQPADPEEARRHADRDRARPAGLPARRPPDGRGPRRAGDDLADQAQQLRQGARHRPRRPRHARRQRHRRTSTT